MLDLMKEIKEYIENMERALDWEIGQCRNVRQLIEQDEMPNVYKQVVNYIDLMERDKK